MTEEIAFTFHFQPSELKAFKMPELIRWHNAARRINKQRYA